jgi:hypothetical protein
LLLQIGWSHEVANWHAVGEVISIATARQARAHRARKRL